MFSGIKENSRTITHVGSYVNNKNKLSDWFDVMYVILEHLFQSNLNVYNKRVFV